MVAGDSTPGRSTHGEAITTSLIDDICQRLVAGKRVAVSLPAGGSLRVDRLLPFLCVYRPLVNRRDEGTARLVMAEASHMIAPRSVESGGGEIRGLKSLVRRIAETVAGQLGAFLILELWAAEHKIDADPITGETLLPRPGFRIFVDQTDIAENVISTLEFALQEIQVHRKKAKVEVRVDGSNHPPGTKAWLSPAIRTRMGCHVIGLEVRPVYRDPVSGETYDRIARALGRDLSQALKKAFFAFAQTETQVNPAHYFELGSSRLPKQVFAIDRQLAELSRQFKFLLAVTPINAERAWNDFSDSGFRKAPKFHYRPLDTDPLLLKRRLMKIATERVDDPSLAFVLRQTQYELDRQITMLADIGTFRFLPGSLQVYENVSPKLRELARKILGTLQDRDVAGERSGTLDARSFARRATKEIKYYQGQTSAFVATASVRDDMYTGLMVTGGQLLIGRQTRIARRRAEAVLQHEVGTHLVTYYNGSVQPLRLLQVGLAGYDALQEGLAVLSEFLVGGLSEGRMRTLAARVIAVDEMVHGTSFARVFQQLVEEYRFEPRTAYTMTLRVFRAGGLTKDALYLRGLVEILDFLGQGGDLRLLLVGKIAVEHVPIVRQLLLSGVLRQPPLTPRYLNSTQTQRRLENISSNTTVLDLIDRERD